MCVRNELGIKIEPVNIKLLTNLKTTTIETNQLLCYVYRKYVFSRPRVFEWRERFLEGREKVEDD
jgi:hypothetical protein